MTGVRRRRRQILDNVRNIQRYWKLKEEAQNHKFGNDSLSHEYKEEIQVISR
jgi:hypothetical protein